MLARTVAVAAILFGAVVAIVLAVITLLTGLVIGLGAVAATWLGRRSRRGPGTGPGAPDGERRDRTVIDVEMREIGGKDKPPPSSDDTSR